MADCGDSPYQAIEYRGLFDLRDAQIVRAEIVAVDRTALTAEVTLLDECEFSAWLNTDAVPFFYHCEDSTGTLEDLAFGHMAFDAGDMVYILLNKATETEAAQANIIGHIDIRSTRKCTPPEYLVVTLALTYKGTPHSYVSIFDAASGAKINLTGFENLVGSPAKPTSLPASTSSLSSWLTYNFEAPTPLYALSGTISVTNRVYWYDWWGSLDVNTATTNYTGDTYDVCTSFSTGNGLFSDVITHTYTGNNAYSQPVDYAAEYRREGVGVTKYELGDSNCRAYWGSHTISTSISHQADKILLGQIVSNGTHDIWSVLDRAFESEATVTNTGDTTEITSSTYSYSCSFALRDVINCSTLSGFLIEQELLWSSSVTGTLGLPPIFDTTLREVTRLTDYSSTDALNALPDYNLFSVGEVYRLCPWLTTMSNVTNCFKVGYYFVYGLIGAISVEEWWSETDHSVTQYNGLGATPAIWPAYISGEPNVYGGNNYLKIIPKSSTVVANIIKDVAPVDPEIYIRMYDCIQQSVTAKAAGLNAVVDELINFMVTTCNPTTIADSETLIESLRQGPSAVVRKKKEA